ncbi:hypothetical protein ARMSODRAFT_208599 [Armillaria solidipes]|uniref:Secreted protein n=1 Tax=Armillaria solidipes TaxID=1076256 RepID=A0A2H3BCN4_9AGAR|nr:hypothetical protein ARMSODRAFT_208599 [Armillaria solidipes]
MYLFIWLSCQMLSCISLRSLLRHVCSVPPCGQCVQHTGRWWSELSFCDADHVLDTRTLMDHVFCSSFIWLSLRIPACKSSRSLLRPVLLHFIWLCSQMASCISCAACCAMYVPCRLADNVYSTRAAGGVNDLLWNARQRSRYPIYL